MTGDFSTDYPLLWGPLLELLSGRPLSDMRTLSTPAYLIDLFPFVYFIG